MTNGKTNQHVYCDPFEFTKGLSILKVNRKRSETLQLTTNPRPAAGRLACVVSRRVAR